MAPRRILQEDSTDSESDSSGSSSSSGGSGGGGVAPTPGRGIGSDEGSPPHATPATRSRSGSPQSSPPPPSQSSKSPQSDRSSHHSSRPSSRHSSRPSSRHSSRPSSRHSSRHSSKHSSRHSSRRSSYSARSHSSARSEHSESGGGEAEAEEVGEEAEKGSVRERRDSSAGSSKSGGGSSKSGGGSSASSRSGSPTNEASPRTTNKSPSRSPASRASQGSHSQPASPASLQNNDEQKTGTGAEDSDVDEVKKPENGEKEGSVHSNDSNVGSPQSDTMEKTKKRKAIVSSDESGGEDPEKDPATAEALFGDADDISSDEDRNKEREKMSDEDEERGRDSDDKERSEDEDKRKEEGEKEEEVVPETRIDVEIPKIICDIGRELHFVKLPNFLSVDTRPFSADTYEDEIDDEETLDEEGRARLKLKVENTMRWREGLDKEGNTIKESNARLVRWSDGSMSLHLGGEIFDVYKQPPQGDHNHLFIRQGTGLQGQAVFRTKLTFRPHSTESFTHRKMTLSLADRSQKSSGIKVLSQVGYDPDQHRGEMIKKEEERLRASLRRESKAKRVRERGAGRNLNASYLEPDREDGSDDDGAISLNAIKDKYNKKGSKNESKQNIYSSEDDASDLDTRRGRKLDPAKTLKALKDSDDEEEGSRDEASQHSDHNSVASDDS